MGIKEFGSGGYVDSIQLSILYRVNSLPLERDRKFYPSMLMYGLSPEHIVKC